MNDSEKSRIEYECARSIIVSVWKKFYKKDLPEWEPCDTLMGILTQFDNMLTEMVPMKKDDIMPTLWEAFIEDYMQYLHKWTLIFTLEAFWHYCQDGSKQCDAFLDSYNG